MTDADEERAALAEALADARRVIADVEAALPACTGDLAGDVRRVVAERDEAQLGCDVLATGDPYERLAATLAAGKVAQRRWRGVRPRVGRDVFALQGNGRGAPPDRHAPAVV